MEIWTAVWMVVLAVIVVLDIVKAVLDKKRGALQKKLDEMFVFKYDNATDIITVGAVKFSGDVLRFLAQEANSGDTFHVIQRKDGVLNIHVTKSEEHDHDKKIVEDTLGKGSL